MEKIDHYTIIVMPLSKEDGGGFIARVPDLAGCIGDGETPEEAVADARRAMIEWIDEYQKIGREVPSAGSRAEEVRQRREAELAMLSGLIEQLHNAKALYNSIDDRIAVIEAKVRDIMDRVESLNQWGDYPIAVAPSRQGQLLLC
jgi:antitoxin HicB